MRTIVVLIGACALTFGCAAEMRAGLADAAARRGWAEIGGCNWSDIKAVRRYDLSPATYEVSGCGKVTHYDCAYKQSHPFAESRPVCVPEPTATFAKQTE